MRAAQTGTGTLMKPIEGKKITITRDGPYEVAGGVDLYNDAIGSNAEGDAVCWQKGRGYESQSGTYYLCRCGHSRDKPYCDGTHEDAEFCGRETADRPSYREGAEVLAGESVNLMDDPSLCVGARFCDVGESTWRYVENSGDPDAKAMAIDEACKCPSGRLTVVDPDGGAIEPKLEPGIGVVQDPANECRGPLWVKGGIQIEGANGEQYEVRNRVTLCRCGVSQNQPFCDGSHYNCENMQGMDE